MILSSIARSARNQERYHGQLNQPRQQLGLSKSPRRSLMLSSLKQFVVNNEEFLYVGVAFGAGTVAAGVVLILVNIL